MVNEVRIYAEGGGAGKDIKAAIRRGFGEFLRQLRTLARERRIRWNIIACGPRNAAFDAFKTALRTHTTAFNVLLVDAEGAVDQTAWGHLHERDGWNRPLVADDQCHLMVQMMEAWFVADIDTLESFYGNVDSGVGRSRRGTKSKQLAKRYLKRLCRMLRVTLSKAPTTRSGTGQSCFALSTPKSFGPRHHIVKGCSRR